MSNTTYVYASDLLTPIRPRIRELEQELSDMEWEGLAPEKMQHLITELEYLRQLDNAGELYVPEF